MVGLRTLFTACVVVVASADATWQSECKKYCTHDKNTRILEYLTTYCEPYRYVLPKPKMYTKCKTAFNTAVQTQCPRACSSKATNMHIADEAQQKCKHEKNETPRPASFEACTTGYKAGAKVAVDYANFLIQQVEDAKAGGAADNADGVEVVEEQDAAKAAAKAAAAAAAAMAAAEAAASAAAAAENEAAAASQSDSEAAAEEESVDSSTENVEDELAQAREAARAAYAAEQAKRKAAGATGTEL